MIDAYWYAKAAHAAVGQKRKYTGEPYIVHPVHVMTIMSSVDHDAAMIAAALLHDVVEDTNITMQDILDDFGDDIASLVKELTDVTTLADGNRAVRKAIERNRLSKASARGQTIKLADLISNAESIMEHDRAFASTFMKEVAELWRVLDKGDPELRMRLFDIIDVWHKSKPG